MENVKQILIPFVGKENGIYDFEYSIDKMFLDSICDNNSILALNAKVDIVLHKMNTVSKLEIKVEGIMTLPCDRCLEDVELPLSLNEVVLVKQGEMKDDEDINIINVAENENEIDCSQFIYESIILAIPARIVHDEKNNSACGKKMMEYLSASKNNVDDEIDPRWEKLKDLKENNL